ncbi:MAG TPA: helix-turn-helix domain-containing protein [Ginsengibacter sp.]|nr:helix-turn-helix domain-containing protein [Ginsengibacter sp.]
MSPQNELPPENDRDKKDNSHLSHNWLTVKQAMNMLDVGITTLRFYITECGLRISKRGRKIWINETDIHDFLCRQRGEV